MTAIQNPAGARNKTPSDKILESLRDALNNGTLGGGGGGGASTVIAGSPWYIGDHARFIALANGVSLEVLQDSTGTWIEQLRWEES